MVAEQNFSSRSGKPCTTGVGFNLTQNSIIQRTSHIGFNGISTIRALTTTMITLTITITIKVILMPAYNVILNYIQNYVYVLILTPATILIALTSTHSRALFMYIPSKLVTLVACV
jgi:acyl-coenzyme A synthetase/AMP-(fatty) acid ligase